MNTEKIIDDAISEKKTITFVYSGYRRTVEPHHYGKFGSSQQLHGYLINGGSKSDKIPGWRNFKIEKIEKLAKNDEIFTPEPSYNPSNSHYGTIEKQVNK